jgi:putative hydrolase of the HAD superfamily
LGINRTHFKENFIFDIFVKEVIVGMTPLKIALNNYLISINSKIKAEDFIKYWLSHDANVNTALIKTIAILKKQIRFNC